MILAAASPSDGLPALAALYAAALVLSAPALWGGGRALRWGTGLLLLAFLVNSGLLAEGWIDAGRPPIKTLFETLVFYPWCVALVTLGLVWGQGAAPLVPLAAAIALVGVGYALLHPDAERVLLPPSLQSGWFVPHVVACFVAYAAFFASFGLGVLSLTDRGRLPGRERALGGQAHAAAALGLVALTAGLIMGSLWGQSAWGDWWFWDPKENWALITWLAYMVVLHLRSLEGWEGRRSQVVLVCAFATVVFTYLGVGMLPTADASVHVYQ